MTSHASVWLTTHDTGLAESPGRVGMSVSGRRFTGGFADPMARLAAFHAEWTAERYRYVTEIRTAHREACEAAALTRARLLAVAAALAHNLDTIEPLLRPVLGDAPDLDSTT